MEKIECPECGKTQTSMYGQNPRQRHCNHCGMNFNACAFCGEKGTDACHVCEVVKGA